MQHFTFLLKRRKLLHFHQRRTCQLHLNSSSSLTRIPTISLNDLQKLSRTKGKSHYPTELTSDLKTESSYSVSGDPNLQDQVHEMADFLETELKAVGAKVRQAPLPGFPSVVLAEVPAKSDPSKKTILCYGHYDVQPVSRVSSSIHFTLI